MKKPILILVAIVVVLVGIKAVTSMGGGDDKALVKAALQESIKASKEGRPGGVMDKISDQLKINDEKMASMGQIANWIKNSKPDITVTQQDPVFVDGEARITSPVKVQANFPGGASFDQTIDGVTLVFSKESATEWLIIPVKKWRLTEVKLPEDIVSQLNPL